MFTEFLKALIVFFVVIDPLGNLLMFMVLTEDMGDRRKRIASYSILSAFLLLLLFILLGKSILAYLTISMESFTIAAGILLLIPAIRLVETGFPMSLDSETTDIGRSIFIVPLGTPLLAGPGAIATAIVFTDLIGYGLTILAIVANLILTKIIFDYSSSTHQRLGKTGVGAVSKIIGIILTALAIQFIIQGIVSFVT